MSLSLSLGSHERAHTIYYWGVHGLASTKSLGYPLSLTVSSNPASNATILAVTKKYAKNIMKAMVHIIVNMKLFRIRLIESYCPIIVIIYCLKPSVKVEYF